MTSIGTKFYTWRFGELVGEDQFGNKYYTEKAPRVATRAKRWVLYADGSAVEASAVPPEWHAWMHRYTDEPPKADDHRWAWQKSSAPLPRPRTSDGLQGLRRHRTAGPGARPRGRLAGWP